MEIHVKKLAMKAGFKSPDLLTRAVGRSLYKSLVKAASAAGENEVVVLDFAEIGVLDSSFIDEFIVKFILDQNKENGYYIKLCNISNTSQLNIAAVFRSYLEFDDRRLVVATEELCASNKFYIGFLSEAEDNVLSYIKTNKSVAADDKGLHVKDLPKILNEMRKLRLIREDGSGRFFSI